MIPAWALGGDFYSVTKTDEELSIVCDASAIPSDAEANLKTEKNWRALKVQGPLDFALTGILAKLTEPLATAKISIFAVSTFDTDYILVKSETLDRAVEVLKQAGHQIQT